MDTHTMIARQRKGERFAYHFLFTATQTLSDVTTFPLLDTLTPDTLRKLRRYNRYTCYVLYASKA